MTQSSGSGGNEEKGGELEGAMGRRKCGKAQMRGMRKVLKKMTRTKRRVVRSRRKEVGKIKKEDTWRDRRPDKEGEMETGWRRGRGDREGTRGMRESDEEETEMGGEARNGEGGEEETEGWDTERQGVQFIALRSSLNPD